MIRVHSSHRWEDLIGALVAALPAPGSAESDLFDEPWLVTAGAPMKAYVELELARHRRISANLRSMSLAGVFTQLTADAAPDVVVIDRDHVAGELLALFQDREARERLGLTVLGSYLAVAEDGADASAREIRRAQTALALAARFDEYALACPTLTAAWDGGRSAAEADPLSEPDQRALWAALFGGDGVFARRGRAEARRYLRLDQLGAKDLRDSWRPPPAVHVFGLDAIPAALAPLLARLGQVSVVHAYVLNPCRQFWEDVGRDPGDNTLLATWGRTARATIETWGRLADQDFDNLDDESAGTNLPPATAAAANSTGPASLLGELQRAIVDRQPELSGRVADGTARDATGAGTNRDTPGAPDTDASLSIIQAPEPRRELEAVAARIVRDVRRRDLSFHDIAVVIAGERSPYLGLLPGVFHEAGDIPFAVADVPMASQSRVIELVDLILRLGQGPRSRREVLEIVTHPNVRARFPDAEPTLWIELCAALGVAHGSDHAAHQATYIADDVFNWDQALTRLTLGQMARGPRSGVEQVVALPDGRAHVPAELSPGAEPDALALVALVRSLLADAAFAAQARLSVGEWTRFWATAIRAYVIPVSADDQTARRRVLTELATLAEHAPSGLHLGLAGITPLIADRLAALHGSRGRIPGHGVAVGSASQLRGVPFQVVFVVGLDAARFPTRERTAPFDALGDGARVALPSARDRDRGAFLDVLLSARSALTLSYVDRDPVTRDGRDPSAVVLELAAFVGGGRHVTAADPTLPPAAAAKALTATAAAIQALVGKDGRVPLARDEDPLVRAAFPAAAAEARAVEIGEALTAAVPDTARLAPSDLLGRLPRPTRDALSGVLALAPPPTPPASVTPPGAPIAVPARLARQGTSTGAASRPRVVTLSQLGKFLQCPLQGSARVVLGLFEQDDEGEASDIEDEPFTFPRGRTRSMLAAVLARVWAGDAQAALDRWDGEYAATLRSPAFVGAVPVGPFGEAEAARHRAYVESWLQALASPTLVPSVGRLRRTSFGPVARRDAATWIETDTRRPLRVEVDGLADDGVTEVDIQGTTELWSPRPDGPDTVVLAVSQKPIRQAGIVARVAVDHLVMAAADGSERPPQPRRLIICQPTARGIAKPALVDLPPLTPREARQRLTDILRDLLADVHPYLFPCEAIELSRDKGIGLAEAVQQIREDRWYRVEVSSRWGPVRDPWDYPTLPSEELRAMFERRLGPLFPLGGKKKKGADAE